MHIYASCGVWKFDPCKGWRFAFDKEKGCRVLAVELKSSFEDLRTTTFENFGIDQNDVVLELSYLPMELISTIDCPPVIIGNDRQVKNFLTYVRGKASTKLCVSISHVNGNSDNIELDGEQSKSPFRELGEPSSFSPRDDIGSSSESSKDVEDECNSNASEEDKDVDLCGKEDDRGKSVWFSLKDVVKRGETFQNKSKLKAALEMSAMKNNFDYKVVNSDRKLWYIRCVDNQCKWSVRAEGLSGSTYFIIKKYVANHTCAVSSMNNGGRTTSAKTIGSLIMHRYDGVKEDADVTKWARCQFQGYMYDIKTTNPAESINSALRSPREYPVIPLLDSIREMLTHTVRNADVLAPESRRGAGRRRKRRYETVEDKLRSSQGAQEKKRRMYCRCGEENHNRATCDRAI
ncbi:hypothetical protein DY000_02060567 [Brassica cretica]|uniref:Transposase MuDR plant domain-containing protein n=1 Tax=Brassica cretica TaxID=69181 RepID=A0ABQ7B2M6_BRACR|nr:hypothetical protein DY000_02060567 [Brassica cretica]